MSDGLSNMNVMHSCPSTGALCLCQYHATLPYFAVAATICLGLLGIGLARTCAKRSGNAVTMFYVFRNNIGEKARHTAALQQQRDAAQVDIGKVAAAMKAQRGRASLEQQLQHVSEQLSASQQAQRKVSWDHCY